MDSKFDKEKAQQRIAALGGGIARIKVGAATETELKDKKLRYEDALNSVKSAIEMGVVPGGGATLLYMIKMRDKVMAALEEKIGSRALKRFRRLRNNLQAPSLMRLGRARG